jgi:hypothetical protein
MICKCGRLYLKTADFSSFCEIHYGSFAVERIGRRHDLGLVIAQSDTFIATRKVVARSLVKDLSAGVEAGA